MGLFRKHRTAPRPRVAISLPDPAEQVLMLRPMIARLTEVVTHLCAEVGALRDDLEVLRPDLAGRCTVALRPVMEAPPARSGDVVGEAADVQRVFDVLNEQADSLWFEKQWLKAEFTVAWDGVHLPGHPSTS